MGLALLGKPHATTTSDDFEQEPIRYSKAIPNNTVSGLQERIEKEQVRWKFEDDTGYLLPFLREMKIPLSSQVLVFSRTSLQRSKINPKTPRAVYFNDDMYVGFCLRGTVLEVSVWDKDLGTVFYTVEQERAPKPSITRQTESCLVCHAGSANRGLPGHLVRSVYPDRTGEPLLASGSYRTDHSSPFEQRWGGWYVTGTHGQQKHLGNRIYQKRPAENEDETASQNVTDLSKLFTVGMYPSQHSDLVALMVLEHQVGMHNRITRALLETRQALHYQKQLQEAFKEATTVQYDSTKRRIQSVGDDLLKYLLFSEEAKLTEPIQGTSNFANEFTERGPFDKKGRSLRQFDLKNRIFTYPCSYLIYSPAFDSLPGEVKDYVLEQLHQVLTGKNQEKAFSHLTPETRLAILEILRETKPNLPEYWRK